MPSSNLSPEQQVVDALHEYTQICAGADTCAAREVLEPLLAERDRLRAEADKWHQQWVNAHNEMDRLRASIGHAVEALGSGDDEDSDSPGNMAFAILTHAVGDAPASEGNRDGQ